MKTKLTLIMLSFWLCAHAQPWSWSEDTLSYARTGVSAVMLDDSIFFSGGKITNSLFQNTVDIYDIGEDQWSSFDLESSGRWNAAAVSCGGKVFIAGGSNYPGTGNFTDIDVFDKSTGQWSIEYLSFGRTVYGGAVACSNKVFFAGGHYHTNGGTSTAYTNIIDIYDLETDSWSVDSLSVPRCFVGGVAAGSKIYIAGGATGTQQVTNVIDIFDIETGVWTVDSLSVARAVIAATVCNGKIYFAGGTLPYSVTSTLVEVYDIATGLWDDPIYLQSPRIVTAENINNALVFTGHMNTISLTGPIYFGPSNGIVEVYYPETGQWDYSVPDLDPARYLYAHASCGDKIYYGGGLSVQGIVNTVNILEYDYHCLPEGIIFSTQAEIDSFQINYPGCTEIEGGILICGGSDITNLNGLHVLTSIGDSLSIRGNDLLNSLDGLDNITTIGGNLNIGRGYEGAYVGNISLSNLLGLHNLTSIGGNFVILGNDSLLNLEGLNNLTSIGGYLKIGHVYNNGSAPSALINLSGIENLTSIGGPLYIIENNNLTSLNGLDNLSYIGVGAGYSLIIIGNNSLANLNGLENINSLEGRLVIGDNDSLTSISGLSNLNSIGGLNLEFNDAITNLTGLENVTSISGDLSIHNNPNLSSLGSLENLTSVSGHVIIMNNNLTNLMGLNNLNFIGDLLKISYNQELKNLNGLENLTTIGGMLNIESNDSLTSLTALENLTLVSGGIEIGQNWVGSGNLSLTSLSGLENISPESIDHLIIANNDLLSECEVQSICDYLVAPNGTVNIHDNATSCNTPQQVQDACDTILPFVKELNPGNTFFITPNPLESTTLIGYTLPHNSPVTLKILDLSGREMTTLVNEVQQQGEQRVVFNTVDLVPGIYFCVLKTNEGVQTRKMIKL
ncbi:MAG: T9SS type A sorting domain-containing protein [Bacteroidales bacterium]|nr:T9SS type A sorting domain-containing protein [Bacteroidales bacterium]